jgi:hypothetical protein
MRADFIKMLVLPEGMCKFKTFPIKIPAGFFSLEIEKLILSLIYKCKRDLKYVLKRTKLEKSYLTSRFIIKRTEFK